MVATSLLAVLALAACGGAPEPSASADPTGGPSEAPSFEGVQILGAGGAGGVLANLEAAATALREDLGIETELVQIPIGEIRSQMILDNASAHRLDTIINFNAWVADIDPGALPLNDYIQRDGIDLSAFIPGYAELFDSDGVITSLPFRGGGRVLLYRTDLLAAAGYDSPPRTLEELAEMANALTTSEHRGLLVSMGQDTHMLDSWSAIFLASGGDFMVDGKYTFDSDAGVNSVEYLLDLRKSGAIGPEAVEANDSAIIESMQAGRVAMAIGFSGWLSAIADPAVSDFAEHFSAAGVPYGQNSGLTASRPLLGVWALGVSRHSKNPDAAWEFVKKSFAPDVQAGFGAGATVFSVYDAPSFQAQFPGAVEIRDALSGGTVHPQVPEWADVQIILMRYLSLAFEGDMSAKDALTAATNEANALVQ